MLETGRTTWITAKEQYHTIYIIQVENIGTDHYIMQVDRNAITETSTRMEFQVETVRSTGMTELSRTTENVNGERNGKGTEYYRNGEKSYIGNWKNGQESGKGMKYHRDGTLSYDGE
eukprot:727003_1